METFTITNIYLGCILLICHSVTRINFQLHYLSNFFIDFRYYEDPSDQFRNKGEGTLMLMWNMVLKKEKIFTVTDMCWNPIYFDMFAITVSIPQCYLSSTDNPDVGYVCVWLLKNSSYPDFVTETDCGAMCLSFHHQFGYNLVVGFRDGGLAVYNINMLTHEPQYKTDLTQTRHMACVRQVVWGKDLPSGELNFFSVSEDGTVCQWLLVEFEMVKIVIMTLIIEMDPEIELGGIKQTYYAKGTTITFNPNNDELYMVGTTEGYVYKCNTAMSSFTKKFRAHEMEVNRIDYNKFDSNIFITCSNDFMVKLWEDDSEGPLIMINLRRALCDVHWSPFSSTVFVILTVDCHMIFYDLNVSLKKPVCDQLIQSAEEDRPTRMIFNKRVPMVLVGSSRSTVITFKLSPGLRATMKSPKKGVLISVETMELEKLYAILDTFRKKTNKSVTS
uniref:Dynein intermediate chain 2, ciliary n=1 Tax=Sipha flava TaxID=143950 RepID=A0A2S2QV56_9HEMI